MRSFLTALALILVVSGPASAGDEPVAPDWSLASADGETIRLSAEVREQPVIILFWATWCPYCKALMPHLQSIRLEHGEDVKILAINFREDGDPVEFIRNAGYDFTVLPDGDEVAAAYGVHATPGVIVVDAERLVRFDLRALPRLNIPPEWASRGNSVKAAYLAPYWAAEIRKSLDRVLGSDAP